MYKRQDETTTLAPLTLLVVLLGVPPAGVFTFFLAGAVAKHMTHAVPTALLGIPGDTLATPLLQDANMLRKLGVPHIAPVSYTHLDVYKRQGHRQLLAVQRLHARGRPGPPRRRHPHPRPGHAQRLLRRLVAAPAADVYKRQGPQGQLDSAGQRWEVGTPGQPRTADDYNGLIVRHQDGATIRLAQIARVSDSVENRYSSGFHNHNPAVVLTLSLIHI